MKKVLIIFGSFILFLITIGTMFKLMHWPGAGPMLVLGMFFFSGFFLPLFFINRMASNPTGLNITTNIFALVSTMMLFTGVMFKVMHWPGAAPMIVFGSFIFIFPTIILYVVQQFKEYDRKFGEFWKVVTLGILVSVFFMFWGTSVSRNILYADLKMEDAFLESNKDLQEINTLLMNDIVADSNAAKTDPAKQISKLSGELYTYIEDLKIELVSASDMNPLSIKDHWKLNSLDNYDMPTHFLCGPQARGQQLYEQLNIYKQRIAEALMQIPGTKEDLIKGLGDYGVKTELNPELMYNFTTWEDAMFMNQPLSSTLALLTGIQHEVLNSEFKCLKVIGALNKQ